MGLSRPLYPLYPLWIEVLSGPKPSVPSLGLPTASVAAPPASRPPPNPRFEYSLSAGIDAAEFLVDV